MRKFTLVIALGAGLLASQAADAQDATGASVRVVLDKTHSLTLARPAASVVVGQPQIADVTVASPRRIIVIGKQVGETSLVILDNRGQTLFDASLTVVPEVQRHVTIHKGTDSVLTLSCAPRCTGVKNPGTGDSAGGSAAPSGGAAAAAATGGGSAAPASSGSTGASSSGGGTSE